MKRVGVARKQKTLEIIKINNLVECWAKETTWSDNVSEHQKILKILLINFTFSSWQHFDWQVTLHCRASLDWCPQVAQVWHLAR